jgi:hypothetical protein
LEPLRLISFSECLRSSPEGALLLRTTARA